MLTTSPAFPAPADMAALPPFAPRSAPGTSGDTPLRAAITAACRIPESQALAPLLQQARLDAATGARVQALALRLAQGLRQRKSSGRAGLVQDLLQEFALSSQEGVALMCLAEALLRIPDTATRNALIRDKIRHGDWQSHLGQSPSLFVNAAAWGLLFTGKLVATHSERGLGNALLRLTAKGGEPLIRKGVDMAMRMMGEQFVTGETIEQALGNAQRLEAEGFRYSYDMLGEAALTAEDAARYFDAYVQAIQAIGQASGGRGVYEGPGISIKLSALHPRYSRAQQARVMDELYPRVLQLAQLAREYDIGLNIDAEEADRLELSLDLLEQLSHAPALGDWAGLGFVIQAYQKRCPHVIAYVIDLARRSGRRLMVRLVKGAYWDSEIKRAQEAGLDGYPVYTRKHHTDVSYIACARQLLAAPDAVYPQFATHNAQTLATIMELAGPGYRSGQYEFQCLHGMGEPLYEQVVGPAQEGKLERPCRIYAPVGTHETLLAYLVRRLLENGANTSFVHRIADQDLPLQDLVTDPVELTEQAADQEGAAGLPHPQIPLPAALYGPDRANAQGLDLASEPVLAQLDQAMQHSLQTPLQATPLIAATVAPGSAQAVTNPANRRDTVGTVQEATIADVDQALTAATQAAPTWAAVPAAQRAQHLLAAAQALEAQQPQFVALLAREAGKTAGNAIAEVREAVDFLRYYARQVARDFGPGHVPLGSVVCISPWNFPLAIFTGQVVAALAAGNVVLAKPAEQTPLVAAEAVRLLHAAGIPTDVLQLLPGTGETVGARLVADTRVAGVLFTGSTEVARLLQRSLAQRLRPDGQPVVLIAETGGQNALIVDSSALVEQVVTDAVASAFDSAGQRCSALRVLCVQEDAADRVLAMLRGAMDELALGQPTQLATDVGPVIDAEAQAGILAHIDALRARGRSIYQPPQDAATQAATAHGSFVPPTLITLERMDELEREVFGPVLHVLRYRREDLPQLLQQIQATGYGLTQGLHTRIDETIAQVRAHCHAGNLYVNRNMVGAVVGVQPFGGEGLSGTGPKAGGPLYLLRLLARHPGQALDAVQRSAVAPLPPAAPTPALQQLLDWAQAQGEALAPVVQHGQALAQQTLPPGEWLLPGPTGERNSYQLLPRGPVLCVAQDNIALLQQLAAVLAAGGLALWPQAHAPLRQRLPQAVQAQVQLCDADPMASPGAGPHRPDLVLHQGSAPERLQWLQLLAQCPGPIVALQPWPAQDGSLPLERLLLERSTSINTAAAGGNASLMTLG